MGYANEGASDMDALQDALRDLMATFGSVDNVLEAFGLSDLPQAQRYGIMFGFLVFVCTISAVFCLLVFGGSFQRIAEQAETGSPTLLSSAAARSERALLLERLLEGRERMLKNYPAVPRTEEKTNLTKMLLNEAPDPMEDDGKPAKKDRYIPPYYEDNYLVAYRTCQDRPGGQILSGKPESRFEAYARGYAGCGPYTTASYRRSYGRLYEATCCESYKSEEHYAQLFKDRPYDIIGRTCRLEALEVDRHLQHVGKATCGEPMFGKPPFEAEEVWGFLAEGPFDKPEELRHSFVFQHKPNQAGFAVVGSVTEAVLGVVLLTHDDPENLTIQLEPPILHQSFVVDSGSREQLEACFLLLDRLFAFGYRRVQMSVDTQDGDSRKLATRLGFTLEGVLYKHLIIKDASRDSNVYSILNSDWRSGARASLFKKLYGAAALGSDKANEKKEEELAEQNRYLAEQKLKDAAADEEAKKIK